MIVAPPVAPLLVLLVTTPSGTVAPDATAVAKSNAVVEASPVKTSFVGAPENSLTGTCPIYAILFPLLYYSITHPLK